MKDGMEKTSSSFKKNIELVHLQECLKNIPKENLVLGPCQKLLEVNAKPLIQQIPKNWFPKLFKYCHIINL